ncbi:MAG: hypothetical protein LWW85_00310 [Marinilabiliales bacterium]|nr:hypothetical protein [Marinilabiliales bacterium]
MGYQESQQKKSGITITEIFSTLFGIGGIVWILVTKPIQVSGVADLLGLIFIIFLGAFAGGMLGLAIGTVFDWLFSLFRR